MDFSFLNKIIEKANFNILMGSFAVAGWILFFCGCLENLTLVYYFTWVCTIYVVAVFVWFCVKQLKCRRKEKRVEEEDRQWEEEKARRREAEERQRLAPFAMVFNSLSEGQKSFLRNLANNSNKAVLDHFVHINLGKSESDLFHQITYLKSNCNWVPPLNQQLIEMEQSPTGIVVKIDEDFFKVIAKEIKS